MAKESKQDKKKSSFFGFIFKTALLALIVAVVLRPDDAIFTVAFLLAAHTSWYYTDSPAYMKFLRSRLAKMPKVDPTPIPEISIENFSRAEMMRLSNDLADPIVIRGALKDSEAVKKWGPAYFRQNYGNETIVVREMIDEVIRFQHRTFEDFFRMQEKGRNVSVVASSSIFFRRPEFKRELRSPIEEHLIGPKGEPIMAQQFFVTPGGRSWYHCAVGNNVFRQIAGQKRWVLIDPKKWNLMMCPAPVITATSVTPCVERLPADEREEYISHIPRISSLLNPGDILINGGWWWHDVQSIGTVEAGPQVSVAGRIKNVQKTFTNSPVLTINAILTRILSGDTGDEDEFEIALEDGIVKSWTRDCMKRGRTDCITPV